MLLSRVADALYWIGRYLERGQCIARLVDVAVELGLDRPAEARARGTDRLYASLGLQVDAAASPLDLVRAALFDPDNRHSMAACISGARDNARQVREEISSDMWEQVNALYLRVRRLQDDRSSASRTHYVSRSIIEGVHLFDGITDETMGHGEGWQYLQVARFLERAAATANLLDVFAHDADGDAMPLDQADWVALLRSCSALEGYCRRYTADVRAQRVVEFLLLDPECPRSIRFSATRIEDAVLAIARHAGHPTGGRAERLAGRLRASLDYAQIDEVLGDNPHAYLTSLGRQCAQIHTALYQSAISYPIESALPA